MNKKVLLLTACVTPNGMAYTALQDPKVRENQYLNALRWYLNNTDFPIVMCENTNYQLPKEFDGYIRDGRLEYLTFDGNDSFDKSRGKGFGEALIIQHVIKYSKLIANSDIIMKMTGRQVLRNIEFVANHSRKSNCIYANLAMHNFGIKEALSQFYICPKSFYTEYFFKGIDRLNDSRFYYFEHLLYDSMLLWKKDKRGGIFEFWMPLKIVGFSGTANKPLEMKSLLWIRSMLKYIMHKMGLFRKYDNGFFTDSQVKEFRGLK